MCKKCQSIIKYCLLGLDQFLNWHNFIYEFLTFEFDKRLCYFYHILIHYVWNDMSMA